MLFTFLTDAVTPLQEKLQSPDSLRTHIETIRETVASSSAEELFSGLMHEAVQFGLKVLAALAIYIIGGWIIRRIKKMMRRGFERRATDKTIATFTLSVVSIGLWVLVIILTVGTLGVNTSSLAALLAAGGMAIGMALGGTVQNFAGGIMILAFKPFKVGDFIEALGYSGTVTEVTIVSTKLLTVDNRLIVLPNGTLANSNINNITSKDLRRVDRVVSISYGVDPDKAKAAFLAVIATEKAILDHNTEGAADPFVSILEFADSSINYVVRVWVKAADYWPVYFSLNEKFAARLPEMGVTFPFPQVDVHLSKEA